jgi:hypothetical protein
MNKEQLRMQMLAGIITESQYKAKLNENTTFTLIGPDPAEEKLGPIEVMTGDKEQILDYVINKIATDVGYEVLPDGTVVDSSDREEMFSSLEEFKEFIWKKLTNEDIGFGFQGEEYIVK